MTDVFYLRQGECNWCGQCCGSGYAFGGDPPIQESPWPISWPERFQAWLDDALFVNFVWRTLISRASLETRSGEINWRGFKRRFIFVPGQSLCLDLPTYGDPSTYEPRCPALVLNGEGNTPPTECGLAPDCPVWSDFCSNLPPDRLEEDNVTLWQNSFPACSYSWVME